MSAKKTYQDLQVELDDILQALQSGKLDIDEAIQSYERGSEIVKELEQYLKTSENKIKSIKLPTKG